MKCPKCDGKARVMDTVPNLKEHETYRKRLCLECGHTFYSVEFETEPTARFEGIFGKLRSERNMEYIRKNKNKK